MHHRGFSALEKTCTAVALVISIPTAMNTIHNAIERRNYLQFDILINQRIGLNKRDAKGLTPLMKVNHEPHQRNATEMVSAKLLRITAEGQIV